MKNIFHTRSKDNFDTTLVKCSHILGASVFCFVSVLLLFFCMAFWMILLCNPVSQSLVPNTTFHRINTPFFQLSRIPWSNPTFIMINRTGQSWLICPFTGSCDFKLFYFICPGFGCWQQIFHGHIVSFMLSWNSMSILVLHYTASEFSLLFFSSCCSSLLFFLALL